VRALSATASVASDTDDDVSAPQDLRLVPAALLAWGVCALTLVHGARVGVVTVGAVGACALTCCVLLRRDLADLLRGPLALALVAAVCVGGVAAARLSTLRPPLIERLVETRATAPVELEVASDPLAFGSLPVPAFGGARLLVRAHLVRVTAGDAAHALRVPVVVFAGPAWSGLLPGTRVTAAVRFGPPGRRTEAATLSTRDPPAVAAPPGAAQRAAAGLRGGLRDLVAERTPDVRGLVPGMVLGDTAAVPEQLRDDERTTGLTHLTAVSGTNVAVLLGAVVLLMRVVGVRRALRLPIGLVVLLGFVVVVRPQPSVLRASVMGAVLLVALTRGHRTCGAAVLSAAVIGLLLVDPWLALMPGFALSVVATGALLLVAPRWCAVLERFLPRPVAVVLAVAGAAHVATVPLIVALSGELSLVALLANVLAEPAVVPVTVGGSLATVLEPFCPPLAQACVLVAAAGAWWVAQVAHGCAGLPAAAVPWPDGPAGVAVVGVCSAVLLTLPWRRPSGSA
jgi:competence protein ComEC